MSKHKGWWFTCWECLWRGIRYPNTRTCPKCHGKTLDKERSASKEEKDAAFQEVLRRHAEIPE